MASVDVSPEDRDAGSSRALADNAAWISTLRGGGPAAVAAAQQLRRLLLTAAHHHISRVGPSLSGIGEVDVETLAELAADDSLVAVLRRLDAFKGNSNFQTWAYKHGVLYAGARVRRQAWRQQTAPGADCRTTHSVDERSGQCNAALARAVQEAMDTVLTPQQRRVASALLVQNVPIDLLTELLGNTRNEVYQALHEARTRLRQEMAAAGLLDPTNDRSPK